MELTPQHANINEKAYDFWRRLGSPQNVLAPMVGQSELAFRYAFTHYAHLHAVFASAYETRMGWNEYT
jgi:hypothetical protein